MGWKHATCGLLIYFSSVCITEVQLAQIEDRHFWTSYHTLWILPFRWTFWRPCCSLGYWWIHKHRRIIGKEVVDYAGSADRGGFSLLHRLYMKLDSGRVDQPRARIRRCIRLNGVHFSQNVGSPLSSPSSQFLVWYLDDCFESYWSKWRELASTLLILPKSLHMCHKTDPSSSGRSSFSDSSRISILLPAKESKWSVASDFSRVSIFLPITWDPRQRKVKHYSWC